MTSARKNLKAVASRWFRRRFAFPLIASLGALLLLVSEQTYKATTSTLQGGIELTDVRIQSLALLQKLYEAEIAQFSFLTTGQQEHLAQLESIRAELPVLLKPVTAYFQKLEVAGSGNAMRIGELTQKLVGRFDRTLILASAGANDQAVASMRFDGEQLEMTELKNVMKAQLSSAAALQNKARSSIYDALFVNRLAVGSLTLIALLSLFLFQRQLRLLDRVRDLQRDALLAERSQLEIEVEQRTQMLAALTAHLQTVREDERSNLARELHDELGSLLTAGKLEIARARAKVNEPVAVLERLDRVIGHINSAIALKRRIIEDLRPSALSNLGLMASLEILCRESSETMGVTIAFSSNEIRLSEPGELTVYRFVQEALTNCAKYAEAKSIEVDVQKVERNAVVTVRDDGAGFDLSESRVGHHGLSGMTFRAESLGGSMTVTSSPGDGTSLRIVLPLA